MAKTINFRAGDMAKVVERLASKHEALSSNPNTTKTSKQNPGRF